MPRRNWQRSPAWCSPCCCYTAVGEKSDIWGGADVTSFKNELMSETGKKLAEFLRTRK